MIQINEPNMLQGGREEVDTVPAASSGEVCALQAASHEESQLSSGIARSSGSACNVTVDLTEGEDCDPSISRTGSGSLARASKRMRISGNSGGDCQDGAQASADAKEIARLEKCSRQDLVTENIQLRRQVSFKEKKLSEVRKHTKKLQRKLAAEKGKRAKAVAKASQQIAKAHGEREFEVRKLGKQKPGRGGRFSLQSKFSIGLRRSLTQIAAADFGIVALCDVSKQTVLRSECMTGAGVVKLMQVFVAEGLGRALDARSDNWQLFGTGFRSDATNSNIYRRKKLHVLEADVLFLAHYDKLREGDFDGAIKCRHCV